MKRRISTIFLTIALLLTLTSTALAAESTPTVQLFGGTALAGDTTSVTISLANNPGIISLRLSVSYDTSVMTLIGIEDKGCFQSVTFADDAEKMTSSPYVILWHSATAAQPNTTNGVIATLKFSVKADAADGTYPVGVSCQTGDILDFDLKNVAFTMKNAAVTVQGADGAGQLGDSIQWVYDKSAFEVVLCGEIPQGCTVYLADYDASGRMVGLKQAVIGNRYALTEQGRAALFLLGSNSFAPACTNAEIAANKS